MAGGDGMKAWPEGEELIAAADQYLAQVYEHRGRPLFVVGNRWRRLEQAVDNAYSTRDPLRLKAALRTYAKHVVDRFDAGRSPRHTRATPDGGPMPGGVRTRAFGSHTAAEEVSR
jgi:predicted secreted Zn-dependent protease